MKIIDNDLGFIDIIFGFNMVIDIVIEVLDRLYIIVELYYRIMIFEVMGRNVGFIVLELGIVGLVDVILLFEILYDINKIIEKIEERKREGKLFIIIVVVEGVKLKNGDVMVVKIVVDSFDLIRFGGIGNKLVEDLEKMVNGREVRCIVFGYF